MDNRATINSNSPTFTFATTPIFRPEDTVNSTPQNSPSNSLPVQIILTPPQTTKESPTLQQRISLVPPAVTAVRPTSDKEKLALALETWVLRGTSAEEIRLRKNAATIITVAFISRNPTMVLKDLKLTDLPDIFNIPPFAQFLEKIDLENNQLTDLPPSLGTLSNLQELCLNKNLFTKIPTAVFQLSNLQGFEIANNTIKDLPDDFEKLPLLNGLDISYSELDTVPSVIGKLKNLQGLNLGGNNLSQLPDWLQDLPQLLLLFLNNNKLANIPLSLGNCPELGYIDLNENLLEEVPLAMSNLRNLQTILLSGNKITKIPNWIGNTSGLTNLNISKNPLCTLPMSLGSCQNLLEINTSETSIPRAEADAILLRCQELRAETGCLSLPGRAATWIAFSGEKYDFTFLSDTRKFSKLQQAHIDDWLSRLEKTEDFGNEKAKLASLVCRMLIALDTSPEFKAAFFTHLDGNLEGCGDRAATLFNFIYTDWKVLTGAEVLSDEQRLAQLAGIARTEVLRLAIQDELCKISGTEESTEVYLYFEATLKDDLGLETATNSMLYPKIGKRSTIDPERLKKAVLEGYLEALFTFPIFASPLDKVLSKNRSYLLEKEAIVETAANRMAAHENSVDDKQWAGKQGAYFAAANTLVNEKESALAALRKKYAAPMLQSVIAKFNNIVA